MREKYETLSLAVLRELAKARGLRGISGLKKSDLIDRMVTEDEKLKEQNSHTEAALETAKPQTEQPHIGAQPEKQEQAQSRTENRTDRQERPEGRIDRQERPDTRMEGRTDRQERPEARADRQEAQNAGREMRQRRQENENNKEDINSELDSGVTADGILEVMPDGYGFIRCENYLPGEHDVYVSPSQIRRFGLKTGDIVRGNTRIKTQGEKFSALLYITTINGYHPSVVAQRRNFEDLTPIFPNARLRLETNRTTTSMRIVDLVSPIGKGQR